MATWWIGEVVPLAITALLPLVLAPLFGVATAKEIAPQYAKSPIFLFFGGFVLALAIEKQGLHRFISSRIISVFGRSEGSVFVGVSLSSFFLSMWISNTSTTLIMIPVILSLPVSPRLRRALAFGAAYSASIGGIATLVGTPPNIVYAGVLKNFGFEVSFVDWMAFGLPYALAFEMVFLVLSFFWFRLGRGELRVDVEGGDVDRKGKAVLAVFLITVLLWLTRTGLDVGGLKIPGWQEVLGVGGVDDSTVAVLAAVALFVLGVVRWEDVKGIPWDALLLFGGGFALSFMIVKSGLSEVFVGLFRGLNTHPHVGVMIWASFTLILTEFASNTSISAILIPLAYSFASATGMDAAALSAVVAVAASGAFMLPVATPPNMLVYSFRLVDMRSMLRLGLLMNLLALLLNVLITYRFAP